MATLVTGASGFVASNIVRMLIEQGERVVAFDIVPPSDLLLAYIKPWARRVTFIQGDILNRTDLEMTREQGITKIVHAAVFTGILPHIEAGRSKDIVEINMVGTSNVLELARLLSVERFIYVSSGSVYGDDHPDPALTEASMPRPHTLYAVTKYASELVTRRYGELHNFPTVSVRLGTPFGPMERVTGHRVNQSLLKEWTGSIVQGLPIKVGDQSVERTFTYVLDIAGGVCAVVNAPFLSYDLYNVSTGDKTSLKHIIEVLRELHPDLQVLDSAGLGPPPGGGNFMKSDRLVTDLGFCPQYNLRPALKEYLGWRRANDFEE